MAELHIEHVRRPMISLTLLYQAALAGDAARVKLLPSVRPDDPDSMPKGGVINLSVGFFIILTNTIYFLYEYFWFVFYSLIDKVLNHFSRFIWLF